MHLCNIRNFLRKLYLHTARFFTFLVALQILNMGLFVQSIEPLASPSSISDNNIINSVVEYVSEVMLNKINAIPESNNKANKDLQNHKHIIVKMIELQKSSLAIAFKSDSFKIHSPLSQSYYYRFYKEINPPPPKA